MRYLKYFTVAAISMLCLLWGTAAYAGGVEIEAEKGEFIGEGFTLGESEDASGGGFITAQVKGNMVSNITMPSQVAGLPYVKTTFELKEDGRYIIWARKRMPTSASDSFHIVLDEKYLWFADGTSTVFDWRKVAIIRLEKGTHTLNIYPREPGAMIDKFVLTTDATYTPTGMGEVPEVDKLLYENGAGTAFYSLPSVVPPSEHPRLFVRKSDIPEIKKNLTHPQNIDAYERVKEYAAQDLGDPNTNGYNVRILSACLSRAFLYLVNGDEEMGRSAAQRAAIYMKNCGENVGRTGMDVSRNGGHMIMVLSCVYDWCYDLMTPEEREMFINGAKDLLMVSEYPYPMIFPEGEIAGLNGHDDENVILRDTMALGIAVYDEDPFIYNHNLGLLTERYFPARNFIHPSGYMPNGQDYGCYRASMDAFCYKMLDKIGAKGLLTNAIFKLPYQNIYDVRGDGVRMEDGDGAGDNGGFGMRGVSNRQLFFLSANTAKDPYIKGYYYQAIGEDKPSGSNQNEIQDAFFLIFNDVNVGMADYTELPLTKYYTYPATAMMARTGWDMGPDSNNVMCFMKAPELYVGGHHHYDSGHFQLYYKGILAMDSGVYESDGYIGEDGKAVARSLYGSEHDVFYHKATVAHNCMMVYDPEEAKLNNHGTANGGQRFKKGAYAGITTEDDLTNDEFKVGETIGYDFGPDMHQPEYTYLESDLKYAYTDKVSEYTRSFMFLNIDDEKNPGALIVYDRIKSSNKRFKKSWLLHSMEEPEINGNTTVIKRTQGQYNGRLVNNTLLPEKVQIEKVGGPGYEYYANGKNYYVYKEDEFNEGGNWRIEISPQKASEQDYFLNVLQVGDNEEENIPLDVSSAEMDGYIAVYIKDKAVFMKKEQGTNYKSLKVKAEGEGNISYIITNLKEGKWTAYDKKGKEIANSLVDGENGVFYFNAKADEYTVKWSYESNIPKKDFSTEGNIRKNEYRTIFSLYNGYFETNGILYNEIPMVDAESFAKRIRENGISKVENNKIEITIPADEIDKREEKKIIYEIGSKCAILNGREVSLSEVPMEYMGKYYVPLEYWNELLSCEISYNPVSCNITFDVPGYIVEGCNPLVVNHREPHYADIKEVYGSPSVEEVSYGYASVDNNMDTYWSTGDDGGYMIWELIEPRMVDKLELAWHQGSSRYTFFEIHTSKDGVNWTKQFDGQSTGKTRKLEDYRFEKPVEVKYVKIVGHGNSDSNFTSLLEIKIHCAE